MKNKERFAKEIVEIAKNGFTVGLNRETRLPMACDGWRSCVDCVFHIGNKDCQEERKKWFEKDPSNTTMVRIELKSLEAIKSSCIGELKGDFDMLNNSDKECRLIEDVKKELLKKIAEEEERR